MISNSILYVNKSVNQDITVDYNLVFAYLDCNYQINDYLNFCQSQAKEWISGEISIEMVLVSIIELVCKAFSS